MVTENPIGRPLAGQHGKQRLAHYGWHGHVAHLMRLRRGLRPLTADARNIPHDAYSTATIIHILHPQPAHLAPAQAAQAKHQHERLAVGRLYTCPSCLVRDGQQLLDGQIPVQSPALTPRQCQIVGRSLDDEPVLDGEIADSFEHADDLEHRGRCQFFRLAADKGLQFSVCDGAYLPCRVFRLHVRLPRDFVGANGVWLEDRTA